jgi:hypothetical protein
MNGKYTDPKTHKKDAMLGSFWGSLGAAPATSRKTARRALQSAGKAFKLDRKKRNAPY